MLKALYQDQSLYDVFIAHPRRGLPRTFEKGLDVIIKEFIPTVEVAELFKNRILAYFGTMKLSDGNGSHFLIRFSVDSVKPHSTLHPYSYTPELSPIQ